MKNKLERGKLKYFALLLSLAKDVFVVTKKTDQISDQTLCIHLRKMLN